MAGPRQRHTHEGRPLLLFRERGLPGTHLRDSNTFGSIHPWPVRFRRKSRASGHFEHTKRTADAPGRRVSDTLTRRRMADTSGKWVSDIPMRPVVAIAPLHAIR